MKLNAPRVSLLNAAVFCIGFIPAGSSAEILVCLSGCDFSSVQAGIDAAGNNETITVKGGIYRENIALGQNKRLRSESGAHLTHIIGDKSTSVVNLSQGATINGFSISNGNAQHGAGIYVSHSSNVSILNNIIKNNTASIAGGGVWVDGSAILKDNELIGNAATEYGGAIAYNTTAKLTVAGNKIAYNIARLGGGIYFADRLTTSIDNSLYAHLIFEKNVVVYNNAVNGGGGYVATNAYPRMRNNVVAYNVSEQGGGFYISPNAKVQIFNSTVVFNTANNAFGGIFLNQDEVFSEGRIVNSIVWGNISENINILISPTPPVAFSNLGVDNHPDLTNMNENPMFKAPVVLDFSLMQGSRLIDAGANTTIDGVLEDIRGFTRALSTTELLSPIDIGAYEYIPEPQITITPSPTRTLIDCIIGNIQNVDYVVNNWLQTKPDREIVVFLDPDASGQPIPVQYNDDLCLQNSGDYDLVVELNEPDGTTYIEKRTAIRVNKQIPRIALPKSFSTDIIVSPEQAVIHVPLEIENWPIGVNSEYYFTWQVNSDELILPVHEVHGEYGIDIPVSEILDGSNTLSLQLVSNGKSCEDYLINISDMPSLQCISKIDLNIQRISPFVKIIEPVNKGLYRDSSLRMIISLSGMEKVVGDFIIHWSLQKTGLFGEREISSDQLNADELTRGVGKLIIDPSLLKSGDYRIHAHLSRGHMAIPQSGRIVHFSIH